MVRIKDSLIDLSNLDIQLSRRIESILSKRTDFRQKACLDKPHPPFTDDWKIIVPKNFRQRRALAIASWYFPDNLKWEIILRIKEESPYSLDFRTKGLSRSLSIALCSESKEIMLNFLSSGIIPTREIFGTILQDDLNSALSSLKIYRKHYKLVKRVRRKGYRDKGSWKRPDRWSESSDFSFNEYQNQKEFKEEIYETLLLIFKSKLF